MTADAPAVHPVSAGDTTGLAVRNLTVRYGDHVAVDDVSLDVHAGQWVALIGPNGAGKTSLLHAITGAVPCKGTLSVGNEHRLHVLPPRRRARRVALVPQQPLIPDAIAVFDYALLGRTAHLPYLGVESARDREIVTEALGHLGLLPFARRAVHTLSGGEQQRVVLARALAQQTQVLLMDEPTSALDMGHRQQVLDLVERLRREHRLTVLAALHDLTLAAQYAERLVLMDAGRVVASGTAADVLTRERIAGHFAADVHVLATPDGGVAVVPARRRA